MFNLDSMPHRPATTPMMSLLNSRFKFFTSSFLRSSQLYTPPTNPQGLGNPGGFTQQSGVYTASGYVVPNHYTLPMHYNPDLSCCLPTSSILNLQLMSTPKAFKQTGTEYFNRDNKSATVVCQTTAGRAILQRGRVSPTRRMRWPVRVQQFKHSKAALMDFNKALFAMCVAVTQVLLRGILQVSKQLLTWESSSHQLYTP